MTKKSIRFSAFLLDSLCCQFVQEALLTRIMNKLYTYYLFLSVHFLSSWRHMTLFLRRPHRHCHIVPIRFSFGKISRKWETWERQTAMAVVQTNNPKEMWKYKTWTLMKWNCTKLKAATIAERTHSQDNDSYSHTEIFFSSPLFSHLVSFIRSFAECATIYICTNSLAKFPIHCLSATGYVWRSCYSRVYLSKNVTLSNFGCCLPSHSFWLDDGGSSGDCRRWQKQPNNASLFSPPIPLL